MKENEICELIRKVIQRYEDSSSYQREIIDLSFPLIMMGFAIDQSRTPNVRVQSLRALVALFGTEYSEIKTLLCNLFVNNLSVLDHIVQASLKALDLNCDEIRTDLRKGFEFVISSLGSEREVNFL